MILDMFVINVYNHVKNVIQRLNVLHVHKDIIIISLINNVKINVLINIMVMILGKFVKDVFIHV